MCRCYYYSLTSLYIWPWLTYFPFFTSVVFPGNISLESARYYTATVVRGLVWDAISYASQVVGVMKGPRQKLLRFQDNSPVSGVVDLPKLGKGVSTGMRSSDIRPGQ
jgi:hypothetical protein